MDGESPASSYDYTQQETNPPSSVDQPPPSDPSYETSLTLTYTPPSNVGQPPPSDPSYETSLTLTYTPPSNVGQTPPSDPSYETSLTLTYTPPSNVAYSSSHAAYPPPINAATYPPPPIPASTRHPWQQLPGCAGNPGRVPEMFPSEKYPPAFQQHPSMSTVASAGYPVQRPPPAPGWAVPQATLGWSTGLFDCMDDPVNAITTFLVPCLTFGKIAEIIDEGGSSCVGNGIMYIVLLLIGMPCLVSCGYRSRLRAKFNLEETPAPDWAVHCLFECCALCQVYRELRKRGLDPEIGWHENVAKNQGVALTPPKNQAMIG